MPVLAAAYADGRVSTDQVAVVARVFANPRICSRVVANDVFAQAGESPAVALAIEGAHADGRDRERNRDAAH